MHTSYKLIIAFFILFAFASCNSDSDESNESGEENIDSENVLNPEIKLFNETFDKLDKLELPIKIEALDYKNYRDNEIEDWELLFPDNGDKREESVYALNTLISWDKDTCILYLIHYPENPEYKEAGDEYRVILGLYKNGRLHDQTIPLSLESNQASRESYINEQKKITTVSFHEGEGIYHGYAIFEFIKKELTVVELSGENFTPGDEYTDGADYSEKANEYWNQMINELRANGNYPEE